MWTQEAISDLAGSNYLVGSSMTFFPWAVWEGAVWQDFKHGADTAARHTSPKKRIMQGKQ